MLISSIDKVQDVATRDQGRPSWVNRAYGRLGQWILGQTFDTRSTLQAYCALRGAVGKAMKLIAVSGRGAGEHLTLSATRLATTPGCQIFSAEAAVDLSHDGILTYLYHPSLLTP